MEIARIIKKGILGASPSFYHQVGTSVVDINHIQTKDIKEIKTFCFSQK